MRQKIFILADWFSPGYKAGGLVTALANLTQAINEHFEIFVMTRDRDLGDLAKYLGITVNEWHSYEQTNVFYTDDFSFGNLRRQISRVQPDVLYLNSFFSPISVKALLLLKLGLVPKMPVVIAPRGELSPGALAIKAKKKALYSRVALRCGLYSGVHWHASSDLEAREIQAFVDSHTHSHATVTTASDIPAADWSVATSGATRRIKSGVTRFVFLSRVSPKKNLLQTLEALRDVSGEVELNIYGPIDDASYWAHCERTIRTLPARVRVAYRGAAVRADVATVLRDHDFFLLPTHGENFGYAILEALAEGCPVLISDKTPWNDLAARGAGWVIPVQESAAWAQAIERCVAMDAHTHSQMAERAREYVKDWLSRSNPVQETIAMFDSVLADPYPVTADPAAQQSLRKKQPYAGPAREVAK